MNAQRWGMSCRLGIVTALLLFGGAALAADKETPAGEYDTAAVLKKLHHSNQIEIEMGKLGQDKGKASDVREFGKTLVTDHTAADQKVMALAKEEAIPLPQTMPPMNDPAMESLKSLSGAEFDRSFAKTMVDDHKKDIATVKTALAQTADPKLKGLLKSTLPVLEKHLDIAKRLVEKVGATANR